MQFLKNPIFVALDVDDSERAMQLARQLSPMVGGFKLGPRLCMRFGEKLIAEIADLAPVFVDNKYFDIPSTMIAAVRASFVSGASFVTVHAQAGAEVMQQLAALEAEFSQQRPVKILAVSILTSFSENSLPSIFRQQGIAQHVDELCRLAVDSGIGGLVCSPKEVERLRQRYPDTYIVTPGIRLVEGNDDQQRVMTPRQALNAGASALVIGRPIIGAPDPVAATNDILESFADAT